MSTTKLNLIFQSDQILDSPRIENKIVLQTLDTDKKLNLTFAAPAGADRNVNFPDPGADDTVVYQNKAQTLTNKTLGSGTTLPDQPQYAHLAGQAGGQVLQGGTAAGENLELESTANAAKGLIIVRDNLQLATNKTLQLQGTGGIQLAGGSITALGGLTFTSGTITGVQGIALASGELTGLPNTPSTGSAATSKNYVDGAIAVAVSGGVAWKETLLTASQLDSTNNAIAQAVLFYLSANPVSGDTLIIRDNTGFDQYSFGAGPGTVVTIGGSPGATMTNLVTAIQGNGGGRWTAASFTNLTSVNSQVVVIWKKIPDNAATDRIYGAFSPATIAHMVNFGGLPDYRNSTVTQVPSVDPTAAGTNFGFGRIQAQLSPSEVHIVRAEDSAYEYNDDTTTWQLSAGALVLATSGPGGGVIGQATYDSSKALSVTAGVVSVKVDGTTIGYDGGGNLTVSGGAVPTATSGPGGGTQGKVSADENFGLTIVGGVMRVKPDNSTIVLNGGLLKSTPVAIIPTGLVSQNVLFTSNIPSVTAPTAGAISSDIPTLDYPDAATTGQLFDFTVPDDYDSGNIEILAAYEMAVAGGNVRYQTQAKIVKVSGSIDTTTYPQTAATLTAPPATPTRSVLMTLTSGTFSRGDVIQVYISRLGADGLDTSTSTWRVVSFQYRYTAQVSTRLAIQTIEAFSDVTGQTATTPGTIGTDIPTVNFPTTPDTAQKGFFIVPDNWDGGSDAQVRLDYAMSTAVAGDVVRIRTYGNIFDVVNNTVTSIPNQDFEFSVSNDTNPHRTVAIRSIPAATLTKGSYVEIAFQRITSGTTGTNHTGSFQVVNAIVALGIAPTVGITQGQFEEKYLRPGIFGNISGPATVSGDTAYPTFGTGANDFAGLYTLASTSAGNGEIDVAFQGRLASFQSKVDSVKIGTILLSGSGGSITLKIYFEGQASAVYTQVITPTGTLTEVAVDTSLISPQPTGSKRFFVVAEGHFTSATSLGVTEPFVRTE